MLVPKTKSTRLVLPRGVAGTDEEPAHADAGTLSFDATTDTPRIKLSTGWDDLLTEQGVVDKVGEGNFLQVVGGAITGGSGGGGGDFDAHFPYFAARSGLDTEITDEFDSGSPDLATRGYSFVGNTVGTMTRVGDIEYNGQISGQFNDLGSTQYRSSIIGSKLFLQLPTNENEVYFMRKQATTQMREGYFWAHVTTPNFIDSGGNVMSCWVQHANPAYNYWTQTHTFKNAYNMFYGSGTQTTSSDWSNNGHFPGKTAGIMGMQYRKLSGTPYTRCFWVFENNETLDSLRYGGLGDAERDLMTQYELAFQARGNNAYNCSTFMFAIDFIRRWITSTGWIIGP